MKYVISEAPHGTYVLGRDWTDVRDRIRDIRMYIAIRFAPGEKILIQDFVKIFEDHEGYTHSDVSMAVLALIEEGILRHDGDDIVRSS